MRADEKKFLTFLAAHLAGGLCAGVVLGGALIATNVGNLRSLLLASPDGWLFGLLFFAGLSVTFGSIGMGAAIMLEKNRL